MVFPIENDCIKLSIDGQAEPQLFNNFLLHVSISEIPNIMVSTPEEFGLKEAIDADNNNFISDSTSHKLSPPQLRKMT